MLILTLRRPADASSPRELLEEEAVGRDDKILDAFDAGKLATN